LKAIGADYTLASMKHDIVGRMQQRRLLKHIIGINYVCVYWRWILNKTQWLELGRCWDGRPFGLNRHGPKSGGAAVPLSVGGAGSLSNTLWPGPRPILPYQVESWSVQPFGHMTLTLYRQDREDDGEPLKPNSITLASSELAPNMFEAGSCQIPLH